MLHRSVTCIYWPGLQTRRLHVFIHVYQILKNGRYNSLCHADNGKYFSGLSLTQNRREAHVSLGKRGRKNLEILLLRKSNFILISEFKYDQTWRIWQSPLSLSLYSTSFDPWLLNQMLFCQNCPSKK